MLFRSVTIPGAIATYLALLLLAALVLAEDRTRAALGATGAFIATGGRLLLARLRPQRDNRNADDDEEDDAEDVDADDDEEEDEDNEDEDDEDEDDEDDDDAPEIPEATPSDLPVSATLAPAKASPTRVKGRLRKLPPLAGGDEEWQLPPLELLDPTASGAKGIEQLDHETNREIIEQKLASFGLSASVAGYHAGPTVTQYEITPDPRVKLSKIESLADDLSMALAARSIRIEAPIPGKIGRAHV